MMTVTQYAISDSKKSGQQRLFVNFYADFVTIRDLDAEIQEGGNEIDLYGSEIQDLIAILMIYQNS